MNHNFVPPGSFVDIFSSLYYLDVQSTFRERMWYTVKHTWVFPLPVWPYAKQVAIPWLNIVSTSGLAVYLGIQRALDGLKIRFRRLLGLDIAVWPLNFRPRSLHSHAWSTFIGIAILREKISNLYKRKRL